MCTSKRWSLATLTQVDLYSSPPHSITLFSTRLCSLSSNGQPGTVKEADVDFETDVEVLKQQRRFPDYRESTMEALWTDVTGDNILRLLTDWRSTEGVAAGDTCDRDLIARFMRVLDYVVCVVEAQQVQLWAHSLYLYR